MSTRYSIAQRTPLLNSLFAGLACAATLALTAGPAMASPDSLERVEVRGRVIEAPVRFDVTASCAGIEHQLQDALQTTWLRERMAGRVRVQFVMQDGEIETVRARGWGNKVERSVRDAVRAVIQGLRSEAGRSHLGQLARTVLSAVFHDLTEGRPDCRRYSPAVLRLARSRLSLCSDPWERECGRNGVLV